MTRHFLQLYVLIVVTLAAVSWGQEKLWEMYSGQDDAARAQEAALFLVSDRLHDVAPDARQQFVKELAARTGVDLELFEWRDIVGDDTLARLNRGDLAYMHAADKNWLLKRVPDDGRVLAFRYAAPDAQRGASHQPTRMRHDGAAHGPRTRRGPAPTRPARRAGAVGRSGRSRSH